MTTNEEALACLEAGEDERAFELFQQAVRESRTVQSLTNLAWFYLSKKDDVVTSLQLMLETIQLRPQSYVPYNLLGEIYIRTEQWQAALEPLRHAIRIQSTEEAHNNLAVAYYHLGQLQEAAEHWGQSAAPSDFAMYSRVICLIELGQTEEAKRLLETFSETDDAFVGTAEMADLWLELGHVEEAVNWYEKSWGHYWVKPDWVGQFAYALYRCNRIARMQAIIDESIREKRELFTESEVEACSEDWTEQDKLDHLDELSSDIEAFETMRSRIEAGYVPPLIFHPNLSTRCYLFGCKQHDPEYEDKE